MELGIFAKTFPRKTLDETLDAVVAHGLKHVQFNLSCVGLPTIPDHLEPDQCAEIARAFRERGLTMAAISGTFNPLEGVNIREVPSKKTPSSFSLEIAKQGGEFAYIKPHFDALEKLAAGCKWLDTRIITLSSGTRNADNMWRWSPQNVTRKTWNAMVAAMSLIVEIADRHQVTMAFEPEISNVVDSVSKARRLLDEIDSPWLKVVLDPANLIRPGDVPRMNELIDEAFDWLGEDIALMHIKELGEGGHAGNLAPGQGILDYGLILNELERIGYKGALIMHGLGEEQVGAGVKFMRKMMGLSS